MTTYTTPLATFDSTTTDGGLGTALRTDNNRPPLGSFCFGPAYDGTCFIIKDNRLYYCKPKRPEAWPSLYYIEVGPRQLPGKTGVFHGGQPHYLNSDEIWYIQGTGNGLFQPIPTNAKTGAQSIRGAASVSGKGIYHTGEDGIYLLANNNDIKITEDSLEPLFRGDTTEGMLGVSSMDDSWLFSHKNRLFFGYKSTGFSYPNNIIAFNLQTNRIAYYTYNDGSDIEIRAITSDLTNDRIIAGDSTGFLRVLEDKSVTTDSGTAIPWELQSKDFTLQTRKHFPRWVKYDVDASAADSVTGALILDGVVHQSHTLTGDRETKRRLVGTGNGNRAAIRISGSGPATTFAAELE